MRLKNTRLFLNDLKYSSISPVSIIILVLLKRSCNEWFSISLFTVILSCIRNSSETLISASCAKDSNICNQKCICCKSGTSQCWPWRSSNILISQSILHKSFSATNLIRCLSKMDDIKHALIYDLIKSFQRFFFPADI